MTCEVCGITVQPMRHEFRVGVIRYPPPSPDWVIFAPLYFAASPNGRKMLAAFCGALCGLKWSQR